MTAALRTLEEPQDPAPASELIRRAATQTDGAARLVGVAVGAADESGFTPQRLTALLGFARALTGDRALAEDITQDVVLRLLGRDTEHIIDLDAYARRMIVNEYLSWRRKWGRLRPLPSADDWADRHEPDPSDRIAVLDDLRWRLECLSRRQRAAIVLRYFADQSDEQIAEALDCSRNAVRSLVSRALAVLRVEAGAGDRKVVP